MQRLKNDLTKDKDNNTGRRKKNTVKKRTDQKDKQSRTEYDIPVLRFCNPAQYINKYSSNTAANTLNQT